MNKQEDINKSDTKKPDAKKPEAKKSNTTTIIIVAVVIVVLLVLLFTYRCSRAVQNTMLGVDSLGAGSHVTVNSPDGQVNINSQNADSWCPVGSTYSSSGTEGSMNMAVVGIETSGKYQGLCHMRYEINTENGGTIDYYYDEAGSGYQVMDINGQKMETQWTKS